jgi:protein-S-isoprenylcysteine O-methyltransferase Ste14
MRRTSIAGGMLSQLRHFLQGTPGQVYVLFPLATLAFQVLRRRRPPRVDARFLPLAFWGYAQYWLCGFYRRRVQRAGGWGMSELPRRLVTSGPYALTRNPMYVGNLLFELGLLLALRSPIALLMFAAHVVRLARRVSVDEERLEGLFGDEYRAYVSRVKRWIPGLL